MDWLPAVLRFVVWATGIATIGLAFLVAFRALMIRQGRVIPDWAIRRIQRFTSLAIAQRLLVRDYGRTLLGRSDLRYLVVPGQEAQIVLPIEKSFVPLRLGQEGASPQVASDGIFQDGSTRTLVIGEPGSGKSSLLRRETIRLAQDLVDRERAAPLPVFLRLGHVAVTVAGDEEVELLDIVRIEALKDAPPELERLWDDLLAEGRLVVLLDGLDEVPLALLPSIIGKIDELGTDLARRNASCRIAVSARPQVLRYAPDQLSNALPLQVLVDRFSLSDIYEFLARWDLPARSGSARATQASVFRSIVGNPHLKQLCQTPLLLAMYCALVSRAADQFDLPARRSEFYERAVRELIVRRQRAEAPPSDVRVTRWRDLAESIAYVHIFASDDPRNQVSWATIEAGAALANLPSDDGGLSEFIVGTGIIREERARDTYNFMHLSFAEYLAARWLAQSGRTPEELSGTLFGEESGSLLAADSSRRMVVLFIATMLTSEARRSVLSNPSYTLDETLKLRAYSEAGDYDAEGFRQSLESVRGRLAASAQSEAAIETLLVIGDLWQQLRPAVAAGDLDGDLALGADIESFLRGAIESDREALLSVVARSDEYTAWSILRTFEVPVHELPQSFVDLLAAPAVMEEFVAELEALPADSSERQIARLVLLESALNNRRVAESLRASHRLPAPSSRPMGNSVYRIVGDDTKNSDLGILVGEASLLTQADAGASFEAPLSRQLASVDDRGRQTIYRILAPLSILALIGCTGLFFAAQFFWLSNPVSAFPFLIAFMLLEFVNFRLLGVDRQARLIAYAALQISEGPDSEDGAGGAERSVLPTAFRFLFVSKRWVSWFFPSLVRFAKDHERMPALFR